MPVYRKLRKKNLPLFTDHSEWLKQPGRYCWEEEGQFPGVKHIEMSWRLCRAPYGSRRLPTHRLVPARSFRGCTTLWDIYGRNQRQGWRRSGEERAEENGGIRGWSLVCTVLWTSQVPAVPFYKILFLTVFLGERIHYSAYVGAYGALIASSWSPWYPWYQQPRAMEVLSAARTYSGTGVTGTPARLRCRHTGDDGIQGPVPELLISQRQAVGTGLVLVVVLALFLEVFLAVAITTTVTKQFCHLCNVTNICCCPYCYEKVDSLCFLTDNSSS